MAARFKARKTLYKGVEMRSRLEAGFAQWCDQSCIPWEYEPHALGGEQGQWLPDFKLKVLWQCGGFELWHLYVEVKPKGWTETADAIRLSSYWRNLAEKTSDFAKMIVATPDGLFEPPWEPDDQDGFNDVIAYRTADDFYNVPDLNNQEHVDLQAQPVNTWFMDTFWSGPTTPWLGEWWKH